MKPTVIEAESTFGTNADGLFLIHSQAISSDFLDSLKSERHAKSAVRAGEHVKAASVPALVWELWIRQGRDPHNATPRQIVSWLIAADLGHFVTTHLSV